MATGPIKSDGMRSTVERVRGIAQTVSSGSGFLTGVAFVLLCGLKAPLVLQRIFPTLFYDELIYVFKARNLATFHGFFSPEGLIDVQNLYAPLYSLVLAPIFVLLDSPQASYQACLFLNAVITSAVVFPLYHVAKDLFPSNAFVVSVTAAAAVSSAGYSLSVMSEAVFGTLFATVCCLYYRRCKTDAARDHVLFWIAFALLLLARNVSVVLIPAYGCVVLADTFVVRKKRSRSRTLLYETIALAVSATPLLLWRYFSPPSRQSVGGYLRGARQVLDSSESLTAYASTWIGQIGYIYIATCSTGVFLLAFPWIARRSSHAIRRLTLFCFVSGVFLVGASTVHMFMGQLSGSEKARYLMYGRYVDFLVPLAVLAALGTMLELQPWRSLRQRPLMTLLTAVGLFVASGLLLLALPTRIEAIRILNMGAASLDFLLKRDDGRLIATLIAAVLLVAVLFPVNYRRVIVIGLLLATNSHSLLRVQSAIQRNYRRSSADLVRTMEMVRLQPNTEVWIMKTAHPQLSCKVRYYFHTRARPFVSSEAVDPVRDYFADEKRLLHVQELKRPNSQR